MPETILVTGATGTVGSALVRDLSNRDVIVRAGVHSIIKGDRLRHFNPEVQLVEMDFERPATLDLALTGVDRAFLITPFTDTQVQASQAFIDAARRAGVKQIVRLSVLGAEAEPGIQLGRWHRATERYLEQSGVPFVILRPNSFMQNLINHQGASIREQNAIHQPHGTGRVSYIDAFDIAAVAAAILTEDVPRHHGRAYPLTGPAAVSGDDIAAAISQATGHPVQYVDVPEAAARQAMAGAPQWMIDGMMELNALIRAGHTAAVTPEVERLTGRPPRTILEFAREHQQEFKPS
ncbi:SDR family oxidoreductase [Hymenobacter coalescens]